MEASNLQIYWHESQPVYSICFQPQNRTAKDKEPIQKLFTAGGDNKIRVWKLNCETKEGGTTKKIDTIDFLSSLQQHEQAVNVVRFNHKGDILASAGDDGQILLWKQNDEIIKQFGVDDAEFKDFKESWYVYKRLRYSSNSEIYDIAWSPCDQHIACACMDNCVRIFDVESEKCIVDVKEHNHYVQGIAWDPLDKFIISQSTDRSVNIYDIKFDKESNHINGLKLRTRIIKSEIPLRDTEGKKDLSTTKQSFLFHNETLPSFFRRLTISPCGSLFCVPTGIFKLTDPNSATPQANNIEFNNAVYIYTRSAIEQNITRPTICLPFLKKPAIVISFNPNFYKLKSKDAAPYIDLPYKLVFAVATSNEVIIYDSEECKPISVIGNLHYTPLTDLCWSQDGLMLMISSTDGFCSYVSVATEMLGETIDPAEAKVKYLSKSDMTQESTEPGSGNSVTTPTNTETSKQDIVNILPVKRKHVAKQTLPEASNDAKKTKTESPSKEKKRIQPTLITL